jgi:hypothetical protein
MPDPSKEWGTCAFCGDSFPPNGEKCPTCGYTKSVKAGDAASLPRKERHHLRFVQGIRIAIILGAVVGLSYLMVTAAIEPQTAASDPLTSAGSWTIGPGNFSELQGEITGDDYIVGNYTVTAPVAAAVTLVVYNDSQFAQFVLHAPAQPLYEVNETAQALLVFSAPYTDTFHFVFENPYGAASGISIHVYIVTNYESNALVE